MAATLGEGGTSLLSPPPRDHRQVPLGKEYEETKARLAEVQQSLWSAREDLGRKSRLLASYKASRVADEHAIGQWKAEVASLEERIRNLHREGYRKDVVIRELRSRVRGREEGEDEERTGGAPAMPSEDRIKGVTAERDRLKQRVVILERKTAEQVASLREMNERVRVAEDGGTRYAAMKAAVERKDSLLKAAKAKLLV